MTRRDYKVIAATLKALHKGMDDQNWTFVVEGFIVKLKEDNSSFREDMFREAIK